MNEVQRPSKKRKKFSISWFKLIRYPLFILGVVIVLIILGMVMNSKLVEESVVPVLEKIIPDRVIEIHNPGY